ncbi:hypothetical protein ACQ4PT_015084 [Festuca glaucescens]
MRTEWQQQQTWHGESAGGSVAVYGWTAAQEDLRGDDAVGMFLRATAVVARSTEDAVMEARCEQAAAAGALGISTLDQAGAECKVDGRALMLHENHKGFFENMPISGHVTVGIKRMGQLDERPFQVACKRKYRDDDPEGKAASLVSSWQEEIQKPSWHPFTTIQEIIDDDDPKLRQLQLECSDNACHAMMAALSELNEYSPHRWEIMNEIWNFREGQKATMTEAITCILEQLTVADPGLGGWGFNAPPPPPPHPQEMFSINLTG